MPEYVDKPEPRGQTIAAVLAVGAIYLALPRNVVVGPIWLLPTVIVVLLVPTVVSHRVGKQSLNRLLGFIINGITTLALIVSVILLVRLLPTHRESPLQLLRSGGLLWLTNVIVFALCGTGAWTAADQPCVRNNGNSAARVSFFHRCKFHMTSDPNLRVHAGIRALSIICSSRSRRVPHSGRPTRRCSRAGQRFWR